MVINIFKLVLENCGKLEEQMPDFGEGDISAEFEEGKGVL